MPSTDAKNATLRFRILRMLARNARDHYFNMQEICTALNERSARVLFVLEWLRGEGEVRVVRRATSREHWEWDTTAKGLEAFTNEAMAFNHFMAHMGIRHKK